jgi:Pin2-interacting protein X1
MLMKMGWQKGKGLGKDEDGRTEHVKVKKRIDERGLGAEADPTGNAGWAQQQQGFTSVLAALNAKYKNQGKVVAAAKSKKIDKQDKQERKEKKAAKKRQRDSGDEESSRASSGAAEKSEENKKAKKSKKDAKAAAGEGDEEDEGDGKATKAAAKAARRAAKEATKASRASRHRVSRRKFVASKNVGRYTATELAAVLGVAGAQK